MRYKDIKNIDHSNPKIKDYIFVVVASLQTYIELNIKKENGLFYEIIS